MAFADEIVGDQIKVQYILSIDVLEVNLIDRVVIWTAPIMSYLKNEILLKDREEARKSNKVCPYGRGVI